MKLIVSKYPQKLQKHISDHLLNFSLLAFLEPDEGYDNLESDAMNVQDSRASVASSSQVSGYELSGTDELLPQESFDQDSIVGDVPELDHEVVWDFIPPRHDVLGVGAESDPHLVSFVRRFMAETLEVLTDPEKRSESAKSQEQSNDIIDAKTQRPGMFLYLAIHIQNPLTLAVLLLLPPCITNSIPGFCRWTEEESEGFHLS